MIKHMIKTIHVVFIALLCTGTVCQPNGTFDEPHPAPAPDIDKCGAACFNLQKLGCPEGADVTNSHGNAVTCQRWCEEIEELGVHLNPECVAKILRCVDLETACIIGKSRT